jgi:hypothetical protein
LFATPWPWLAHAAAWIGMLLAMNAALPPLYLGPPLVAFAVGAAFVSSRLLRNAQIEARADDVARFALVDAVLCGTAALALLPAAAAILQFAGRGDTLRYVGPGLATIAGAFVPFFYASLARIAALGRRTDAWRRAPAPLAAVAVLALAWMVWGPSAAYIGHEKELAAKIAEYEAETGKPGKPVESEISLSLHGFYGRSYALSPDADGRVAVAGEFTFYGGHDAAGFARLERDGRLDRTATSASLAASAGRRIVGARSLAGGALLVAWSDPGVSASPVLRTLLPDGTLGDLPGVALDGSLEARGDGSFLISRGGSLAPDDPSACVRRFLPNGDEDLAFAAAVGTSLESIVSDNARVCTVGETHTLPDGRTLVVLSGFGGNAWRDGLLRRLDADGRLDMEFRPDIEGARFVAIGPSGAVFVSTLSSAGGRAQYTLVKLGDDGARDPAFAPPPGLPLDQALAAQGDGAVLTGGYDGRSDVLSRVLPDGRLDTAFGDSGAVKLTGFVSQIVPLESGEIYLLGDFYDVSARGVRLERSQIARLLADGTPDATFDPR